MTAASEIAVRPTTRGGVAGSVSSPPRAVKKPPREEGVSRGARRPLRSRPRDEGHDDLGAAVLGLALCARVVVRGLRGALRLRRDAPRIDAVARDQVLLGGVGALLAELRVRLLVARVVGEP